MNKWLLAFSVSLITGLAADEANVAWATKQAQTSFSEECAKSCEPCCPKPKPPICCECYVPSYYDLQCDSGLFIYGDFLYWYANEDNLSPCMTVQGTSGVVAPPPGSSGTVNQNLNLVRVNHLGTKWDPGFRAAFGFNFHHDGWDLEANYTWFHNKKNHTVSVPLFEIFIPDPSIPTYVPFFPDIGQLALLDPWINTSIYPGNSNLTLPPILFDKVSSSWKLFFNQIDLELGRKFWHGKSSALRAYAGVRGAWFTTRFKNVASKNNIPPSTIIDTRAEYSSNTFSDFFKTQVWGVGLLGGIQPEWHFCRDFILFSNLDAALLWGKFKVHKKEDYTSFGVTGALGAVGQSINYHNVAFNEFFKMQAILDLALGLRWEHTWCYRIRTAFDLAWENHIWFDDNFRFKTGNTAFTQISSAGGSINLAGLQSYEEEEGNLMMGGAVVRFRIDF